MVIPCDKVFNIEIVTYHIGPFYDTASVHTSIDVAVYCMSGLGTNVIGVMALCIQPEENPGKHLEDLQS